MAALYRADHVGSFLRPPQCGFASIFLGNLLTWEDQRRNLERVVETARRVWG